METVISELNVLLSKLKQYIIDHKLLERHEFNAILHNEILLLAANTNPNARKSRKAFSETETLEYIKMIVAMHPSCLFNLHASKNPLDVARKTDLRKIAQYLEVAMNQNKFILNNENKNLNAMDLIHSKHAKHSSIPLSPP
eukprot:292615_1